MQSVTHERDQLIEKTFSQLSDRKAANAAKLSTLYNRRLQDTAILMYKVEYGMAPRCVF